MLTYMEKAFLRQAKLPRPIKIIVLLLILGVLASASSFSSNVYIFLGFIIVGFKAAIIAIFINVALPILLLGLLYKKVAYAWRFGLAYFGFLTINTMVSAISVYFLIPKSTLVMVWPALFASFLLITILGLAAFAFWHYRKIFD